MLTANFDNWMTFELYLKRTGITEAIANVLLDLFDKKHRPVNGIE